MTNQEIQNALDKNLPDPYFDFREYYTKGTEIYYVYINEFVGEKKIIKIKIRTIYARTLIGFEEDACCHTIGYKSRDQIFLSKSEAEAFYKTVKIQNRYG